MSDAEEILFDKAAQAECPSCHAMVDASGAAAFSEIPCTSCGAMVSVTARLSNYRLLACLGYGGMGSVYRAVDETLDRTVAIKVMQRRLGEEPEFLDSFRREAQAAAKLNHPNIAQIYSFGEEKGQPYIVMEFVPGSHLDKLIDAPGQLAQPMVMKIGMDIADGLQLAAASNLIHGDIKPENILLDDRGLAKLVDFGIASKSDAETTEIWGTPYYISPEKIKRGKVDFRSDMYCLGGTLYHAITKSPPFDGDDASAVVKARLQSRPRPMRELRPDVDNEVEAIIMKMLEPDPQMRYPSYGTLMSDIRQYLSRVEPNQVTSGSGSVSKKIIIKGRRSKPAAPPADSSPAASVPPVTATGLHPRQSGRITGHIKIKATSSRISANLSTLGIDPVEPSPEKKKGNRILAIAIGSAMGVLAIAGTVFLVLHNKAKRDREEDLSRRNGKISMQASRYSQLQSLGGQAFDLRDKTVAEASLKAESLMEKVFAILKDEGFEESIPKVTEEEAFAPPLFGDEDATEDVPDGDDSEEDTPADGNPAENAPPGDGEGSGAAEGEAPQDDAGGEEGAEEAPEDAQEELDGMPAAAREIFLLLAPVRKAKHMSEHVAVSVGELCGKASSCTNFSVEADTKSLLEKIDSNLSEIDLIEKKIQLRLDAARKAASETPKALKAAEAKYGDLSIEAKKLALEREQRAKEEKAREEARIERERKEQEEARRRARESDEIARVRSVVESSIDRLLAHQYDSVLRELDSIDPKTLEFDTSRAALKSEKRRVEALKDLKTFLVQRLSGEDKFVHPKIKWQVLSADERRVEIKSAKKGSQPKRLKWEELKPLEQIVPMVMYYLGNEDKARDIRLRERTSAYLNAAVYFMVFGDSDSAKEAAIRFRDKALADQPSKKSDAQTLLYDLDAPDEE